MRYKGVARGGVVQLEDGVTLPEGTNVTVLVPEPVRGSPAAVLHAMLGLPAVDPREVDELERAVEAGRLPVRQQGVFERQRS
jgi:hypothetical protein